MSQSTVLFVDDDRSLSYATGAYLEALGYQVEHVDDGAKALVATIERSFDVVILDVDMPVMDGFEVVRRMRKEVRKSTPILMLSGRAELNDKLAGLNAGADDYLTKPFATAELRARLEGLIRRSKREAFKEVRIIGDLVLDVHAHEARRDGQRLELSPISWQILLVLARSSPHVVTRPQFEREIWQAGLPDSDTLRSHIYNLRKVLDRPFDQPMLETVMGEGFRLVDPCKPFQRRPEDHFASC
jgi:DNA-binding response OmpR family regulator